MATAKASVNILNSSFFYMSAHNIVLPSINAVGNVSVSRSGQGSDALWSYGYKHRITFDKLTGYNNTLTKSIVLDCAGSTYGCPCLSATAAFSNNGNSVYSCATQNPNANSSTVNPLACTILPNYTISVLYKGGEPSLSGSGSVYVASGRHLLPAKIGTFHSLSLASLYISDRFLTQSVSCP